MAAFDTQVTSSVATGTAPFDVASTTICTNLNVEFLGGQNLAYTLNLANMTGTLSSGTWQGTIIGTTYGGTGINGATAANGTLLIGNGAGYTLATLTGTAARLSVANAAGSITLDISATYVGQATITTLGTIATGVWQGTIVGTTFGGTGLDGSSAANGRLLIGNGAGYTLAALTAGTGIGIVNAAGSITISASGSGTVTSVALTMPSVFSVAGSPVTTSGTLAVTYATQTANTVFAGPTAGGAATPTFRALVAADLPASQGATTVTSMTVSNLTATRVTYAGTAGLLSDDSGFTRVAATSLTVDSGVDSTITLGNWKTGVPSGGTAGSTYVGSVTNFTSTAYSMLLNTSGDTTLNAKTGRSVFLAVNNAVLATLTSTALTIASGITTSTLNASTAATSASTGALVVVGGIGAGNLITATTVGHTSVAAPGSPADGDVWNDSTRKTLTFRNNGLTSYNRTVSFVQTASVTIQNTLVETTMFGAGLGTLTFPANFFVAGKSVRIRISGTLANNAAPTVRWRLKLGGTLLADTLPLALTASAGGPIFSSDAIITCRSVGAAGSFFANMYTLWSGSNGLSPGVFGASGTVSGAINTAATATLDVTFQWGTANNNNSMVVTNAIVEVLN